MTIRPYTNADYHGCILLFESNCPEFFADHEKAEFITLLEDLFTQSSGHSVHYFVVEDENQIVASAGFYLPTNENSEAGLVWGMVARGFHRQGVGRQLLDFRLSEIRKVYPAASVVLDTTQFSFPFFVKAGFRTIGIIKDYYAPGFDRYDMILEPGSMATFARPVRNIAKG